MTKEIRYWQNLNPEQRMPFSLLRQQQQEDDFTRRKIDRNTLNTVEYFNKHIQVA
jgi:hypothetical protein